VPEAQVEHDVPPVVGHPGMLGSGAVAGVVLGGVDPYVVRTGNRSRQHWALSVSAGSTDLSRRTKPSTPRS
jgi:hypothetical protein